MRGVAVIAINDIPQYCEARFSSGADHLQPGIKHLPGLPIRLKGHLAQRRREGSAAVTVCSRGSGSAAATVCSRGSGSAASVANRADRGFACPDDCGMALGIMGMALVITTVVLFICPDTALSVGAGWPPVGKAGWKEASSTPAGGKGAFSGSGGGGLGRATLTTALA